MINPEVNDSLSTLNLGIIDKLSESVRSDPLKYKPSYIARILHRTLPEGSLQKQEEILGNRLQRGVFAGIESEKGHISVLEHGFRNYKNGSSFMVANIIVPGAEKGVGDDLMNSLDSCFSTIKWNELSEDDVFKTVAMMTDCLSASHVFKDGNGRVSIGLAKVFIDAFTSKKLSLKKISANPDHLMRLALGAVCLLPTAENPFDSSDKKFAGSTKIQNLSLDLDTLRRRSISINIPTDKTVNLLSYTPVQHRNFIERYAERIKLALSTFQKTGTTEWPYYNDEVDKLSQLFKKSLIS